jgi:hypothetical protein
VLLHNSLVLPGGKVAAASKAHAQHKYVHLSVQQWAGNLYD